jgi:transcriptional regulator with XRE-family HTH domain
MIEMRTKSGYTVGQLADKLFIEPQELERFEQGQSLDLSLLARAAPICKKTVKVIFTVK